MLLNEDVSVLEIESQVRIPFKDTNAKSTDY